MPSHPPARPDHVFRHFTVAVFVVHAGRVLLHYHRKLGRWLPPGGHIEDDELPDHAALREVLEETGIRARLVGSVGLAREAEPGDPRQLVVPAGVQVEHIYPGHEHIDLVYFAVPEAQGSDEAARVAIDPRLVESDRVGWYAVEALPALGASSEITAWANTAVRAVSERR